MAFQVSALFRYPLKSAAREHCKSIELDRFGVVGDRRWMIVRPDGAALTQRELPRLALLRARVSDSGLTLGWESLDGPTVDVPRPAPGAARTVAALWEHELALPRGSDESAEWLSQRLGTEAILAYMPDDVERPVNPRYALEDDRTTLTDGYPLHLIGSGSLADLNGRLADRVGVERFRPNIFVDGPAPFEEDQWKEIRIGDVAFRVVKPCPRCAVTTVDPESGIREKEPLATLASYRKTPDGVMFGQNIIHDSRGEIRVGDSVQVISRRGAPEE